MSLNISDKLLYDLCEGANIPVGIFTEMLKSEDLVKDIYKEILTKSNTPNDLKEALQDIEVTTHRINLAFNEPEYLSGFNTMIGRIVFLKDRYIKLFEYNDEELKPLKHELLLNHKK